MNDRIRQFSDRGFSPRVRRSVSHLLSPEGWQSVRYLPLLVLVMVALAACGSNTAPGAAPTVTHAADAATPATLPALSPVSLAAGEKLHVVVTTSIIGDVVRNVGGDAIDLTQLLPPGTDPHSYQAKPDDLRQLNNADVIFINGLHLEEGMQSVLDSLDGGAPVISVNIGVPTLEFSGSHTGEAANAGHEHGDADPHTWMDVRNVEHWVDTISTVLSALDPTQREQYAANAAAYQTQLADLQDELVAEAASLPPEKRKLVTDHDSLGYLANAYGFTVVGAVIPSISTMAAPSAQDLAALQKQIEQEAVKAIFVSTTVNPDVAAQIAGDTRATVVPIYTGSLSDARGPAATYIDMMRYDVKQIVDALSGT